MRTHSPFLSIVPDSAIGPRTTGTSPFGFASSFSVSTLLSGTWPAIYALAKPMGIGMKMYEGGNNLCGDAYIANAGFNTQCTEYCIAYGYSSEAGDVYKAMQVAFLKAGGGRPSKFVDAGLVSQYGTWSAIRYFKTTANGNVDDTGNPVWQAVLDVNSNPQPET